MSATKELKIKRDTMLAERGLDLAGKTVDAGRDITLALISNPLTQMLAFYTLIELLQRVELDAVPERWEWQSQPGTHALVYKKVRTPLISQAGATTLQTVGLSTAVVGSLASSGGLSGIAGILGKFLK